MAFLNGIVGAEVMLDGCAGRYSGHSGCVGATWPLLVATLMRSPLAKGRPPALSHFWRWLKRHPHHRPGGADIGTAIGPPKLADRTGVVDPRSGVPVQRRAGMALNRSEWDSPARGMTQTEKLDALRAFIVAITPEEHAKRAEVANLDDKRRTLEQEIGHRRWEIDRTQSRLAGALGVSAGIPRTAHLPSSRCARQRKTVSRRPRNCPPANPDRASMPLGGNMSAPGQSGRGLKQNVSASRRPSLNPRKWRANFKANCRGSRSRRAKRKVQSARFVMFRSTARWLKGAEFPTNSLILRHVASVWRCERRTSKTRSTDLQACGLARTQTLQQLALAKQRVDQLAESLAAIEKARDAREGAWYSARRLVDDVERLSELIGTQETAEKSAREIVPA